MQSYTGMKVKNQHPTSKCLFLILVNKLIFHHTYCGLNSGLSIFVLYLSVNLLLNKPKRQVAYIPADCLVNIKQLQKIKVRCRIQLKKQMVNLVC